MRVYWIVTLALLAGGCMNLDNPLGLDSGGGGGGGGGGGNPYSGHNAKRLWFDVEVVSSADQQPVSGATLRLVHKDEYDETWDRTLRTDTSDNEGLGMVGMEIGQGNYVSSCIDDTPWDNLFLEVEAQGFQPWSEVLAEAGCWSIRTTVRVELTPL